MATQTFVLQVGVAVLVVAAGLAGAFVQAQRAGDIEAIARATAVAETVAATPTVIAAVQQPSPTAALQPYAERVRVESGTDFVVIMSPESTRFTHPDPSQIGKTFLGHTEEALAGGTVVEDYTGTLGPSLRVVKPISDDGRVVALVAVGIRKSAVGEQVRAQLPAILLAGLVAALLSGLGTALVARRIRRQTHGLGEEQLREMYEYYDAVLHAVTEGLLITDLDGRLRLANDEAVRLLDLPPDAVGRQVGELGLAAPLAAALTDDHLHEDELHVTSARVLVLNRGPATWEGRLLGHVATLRDRTDLEELTGELDSARGLAEALRSQAHESANRLHTIVSLIELGHTDRALDFATDELAVSQVLTDRVVGSVEEPALTALLLGKAAEAHERGIAFDIATGARWPSDVAPTRDIVTIVGNLIDNALDAVAEVEDPSARRVAFDARVEQGTRRPRGDTAAVCRPRRLRQRAGAAPGRGRRRLPPGLVDEGAGRGRTARHRARPRRPDRRPAGRHPVGLGSSGRSLHRAAPGAGPTAGRSGAGVAAGSCADGRDAVSSTDDLRVLVVEDEPIAAEAHTAYVSRVAGFVSVATVGTSQAALKALQDQRIDVVLLDMNLPDRHGLDVVRAMRAAGHRADVIAVTSARDLEVVRAAVSLGIVQYVLKPFVFATLRERLLAYRAYRDQHGAGQEISTQAEVDEVFAGARSGGESHLPKGMGEELLTRVSRVLREADGGRSASELGEALGVSRVTARRYAEHLCETRVVVRRSRYAGAGRPEVEYLWSR